MHPDGLPDVFPLFVLSFVLSLSLHPSILASNTGLWAKGAKQRLNLVSEPRLILYSFPLKEHESCSLPVVAAVPPPLERQTAAVRVYLPSLPYITNRRV